MSPPDEPTSWGPARIALWGLLAAGAIVLMGPAFLASFRPPPGPLLDFIQEWLSVRNYMDGTPVYANQTEALTRHTGLVPKPGESMLPWNAHPPASILLALPFGRLPYRDAQFAWNLVTFPLIVLSVALVLRELGVRFRPASILPAVVLTLVCHPLYIQLAQGQLNSVLLPLLVLAWAADRRGHPAWAGVALGAAAAIKLFPTFLFLYFLLTRRWSALVTGGVVFFALNGLAFALFGEEAFRTYAREVVPSVASYQTNWRNVSLTGFWLRVFDPQEKERIIALVRDPLVGRIAANAARACVVVLAAAACWWARGTGGRDRAFAATLTAMLLVSPISWTHYFLLLVVPLLLVWVRAPAGPMRWCFWLVLVVCWWPDNFAVRIARGRDEAAALSRDRHTPLTAAENLYTVSLAHYALLTLFVLVLLTPSASEDEPDSEPAWAASDDGDPETPEARLRRRLFGPDEPPRPAVEPPPRGP